LQKGARLVKQQLVYTGQAQKDAKKVVKVIRMWTHYE
jgi:hypothetical protein